MSNLIHDICRNIYDNPEFRSDFKKLVINEFTKSSPLSDDEITRLLEAATLFASSDNDNYKKLALKIAVYFLEGNKINYEQLPFVIQLILARMGDLPVITHIIKAKDGEDYFYFGEPEDSNITHSLLSTYLQFPEILATKTFNQIQVGKITLNLTDFQASLYYALKSGYDIAFSAPTSAGKSYMLHYYIADQIQSNQSFFAVYIVPTKSLIAEVHADILKKLRELDIDPKSALVLNSASHFQAEHIPDAKKIVLVMTQERLQEMLSNNTDLKFNLLVLDEAQKVSEGKRGVIIEDSIQDLITHNKNMQKVFISPNTENLDEFKQIFNMEKSPEILRTLKSPVGQNIFYVKFNNRDISISLYSLELGEEIPIETLHSKKKITSDAYDTRKVWLAKNYLIKRDEPTLIYCNRPSECLKASRIISEDNVLVDVPKELDEAIQFLRKHVHVDYFLVDYLRSRVGYHYGKMPQFVRFVVKDLFESKKINTLCCTSTLLEGVNLPAKNIIISNPKTGNKFMDKLSILNLAGRAGRLTKDYYGNVYCIDRVDKDDKWDDIFDDKLENVKSSLEETLSTTPDKLIQHLETYNKNVDEVVIASATSLLMKYIKDPNTDIITNIQQRYPNVSMEKLETIKSHLVRITSKTQLDADIILRNRSIDPRLQDELYLNLKNEINMTQFLPLSPTKSTQFYDNLSRIFSKIAKHIFKEEGLSYKYYIFLANKWIGQSSYKRILEDKIWWKKNKIEEIINLIVKTIMEKNSYDEIIDKITLVGILDIEILNRMMDKPTLNTIFKIMLEKNIIDKIKNNTFDTQTTNEIIKDIFDKGAINDIIDDLDDDLETTIKFEYSRCLKCYCDVIKRILRNTDLEHSVFSDLPIYLEAGASDRRVLLLLGVGLSRNSAIKIYDMMRLDIDNTADCLEWLRDNRKDLKGRLELLDREIDLILGSNGN